MKDKDFRKIVKEEIKNIRKEAITPEDESEIQRLIRAEIASVLFDLWRKRKNWI